MARIFLITGGARSGKSEFAEKICHTSGKKVGYIATSEIWDEEMQHRVENHQRRRPDSWKVWEVPNGDPEIIKEAQQNSEILLFDCLTLYLTHWLFHPEIPKKYVEREIFIMEKVDQLLEQFKYWDGIILFVSNEIGQGIVPVEEISREFRDLAGKVNQKVAKISEEVFVVSCGFGVPIKKLAISPEEVLGS